MHLKLLSVSALSLAFALGCVGTIDDQGESTDSVKDDLSDNHPNDDLLADEFDDGLAAALGDEAIPALSTLDDGAQEALDDLASGERGAESTSSSLPHCGATAKFGNYCGGDKVSNGSSSRLYRCTGPNTTAKVLSVCAYGCGVHAGTDDSCNPKPPATCDSTAKSGDYCGGDKVSYGSPNTLYRCAGPGRATKLNVCSAGCVVAAAGSDDHCKSAPVADPGGACPHVSTVLKWGIHPIASDRLRCAGVSAARIMQTIGSAAASAGTHAQDGVYDGHAYSAATDISVKGLSESQVRSLVARLDSLGFAAFYRNPGTNGWPSSEIRHMHVVFAGARMKSSLRSQIWDFLAGRNGLASHTAYTFYQPSAAVKAYVQKIFLAAN